MNHDDIWSESVKIDRERRQKRKELMEEYDSKFYYPELKKLQENCEKLGHSFVFTKFGSCLPNRTLGDAFYHCEYCGKIKLEKR